ncbi:fumarate hydratase [Anaerobacillus alkalidiazotrophicus]|uniref:Fumarate hydratase n=2 Tax=Anaerobacillus TaxID=704093 RepID=A0A1S2M4M3_9BACI|nr:MULTISPECIES: Fe-S-containing hydro-lyase [Anaerobacillus]OIJ10887.1 fumarate hydratase [Anaerobacillus alkalilacustris]OIJ18817.1 fumarate hydratase [Anaerobacillus alkalidiazotrophicus]
METIKKITTPLTYEQVKDLKAGDQVSITGVIYSARDAAHKILVDTLAEGKELPVDFKDQVVYYAGPSPAKPGKVIGSCGPTTSGRMDAYSPTMMEQGLKGMIGKGPRSKAVIESMKENGAVYFAAIGGAAALIADTIQKVDIVAFPELGPEAIRRMEVVDYPCIVAIDCEGNDLYELGVQQYKQVD